MTYKADLTGVQFWPAHSLMLPVRPTIGAALRVLLPNLDTSIDLLRLSSNLLPAFSDSFESSVAIGFLPSPSVIATLRCIEYLSKP